MGSNADQNSSDNNGEDRSTAGTGTKTDENNKVDGTLGTNNNTTYRHNNGTAANNTDGGTEHTDANTKNQNATTTNIKDEGTAGTGAKTDENNKVDGTLGTNNNTTYRHNNGTAANNTPIAALKS